MRESEKEFIKNLMKYQSQEETLSTNQRTQIIKIYDIVEYQGASIQIMEQGQEGLYDYTLNIKGSINILDKVKILKNISQRIWFLNFNEKIHRDIKPENFVRVGNEFKLIDFGLVKQIQRINTINVGSPLFQAPELNQGKQNYSFEIDIWSLGGTFYELLTEDQLKQINFQNMIIKSSDQINYNVQNQFSELQQNMMQIESQKRISIKQVIEWLNQIEFLLQPINAPLPQQNQNIQFQQSANKQLLQASKSVEPQVKQQIDRKSIQQQTHQSFQTNIQPKQANNPPIQANNFMNQSGQMQNQNFQNGAVPPIQNNQNNNNLKLDLQQQLQKQLAQQQEIFQQNFTSITVNLQNLFDQQMKMIKQQNVQNQIEIWNIKQEQQNSYQDIQQLIQGQNKQIERIPIQHQKNNIQIGSQVNNDQIEVKLSALNQLLTNSQKEQKEIQLNFFKILDSNNESKVEIQKQQDMQFKSLFQQLEEFKRQQQYQNQKEQPKQSQDNSSQHLNQILYDQQEMKKILQFQQQTNLEQKNNFAIPNQNIDINQIQISLARIEKEMKKQNEEVKQSILEQLEQNFNQNNYLEYFQNFQQKLEELKQQLAKENQINKSQGNYTQLSKINTELFELKSLVQNKPSQQKLIQSMEELIQKKMQGMVKWRKVFKKFIEIFKTKKLIQNSKVKITFQILKWKQIKQFYKFKRIIRIYSHKKKRLAIKNHLNKKINLIKGMAEKGYKSTKKQSEQGLKISLQRRQREISKQKIY